VPPPPRPERIAIVGSSGVGKSALARQIAEALDLPHLELDSVFHQSGWTQLSEDEFQDRLRAYLDAHPAWVIDGNYPPVRDLIWAEATDVVWLHLPRWRVMRQIIARTVRRALSREELWNGNKEPWSNLYSLDPERSVIAWAWTRYAQCQRTYTLQQADPRWAHARHHKFLSHQAAQQWLKSQVG
jgi:adenylate kinase family enzyme